MPTPTVAPTPATHAKTTAPTAPTAPKTADSEARRLLHELQVHQVEILQQNEELRTVRAELESSLARYVSLFDFAPVGLVGLESDGSIRVLNRRAAAMLGASLSGGQALRQFVAPQSTAALMLALAGGQTGQQGPIELQLAAPGPVGARFVDLEVQAPAMDDDACLVSLVETTERRHAQSELRRARDLLELSGRVAHSGFWELGSEGRRLAWSAMAHEILEAEPGSVVDLEELLGCLADGEVREQLQAAFEQGRQGTAFELEVPVTTMRGRAIWIRLSGAPESDSGTPPRLLGTVQDIDARIRLEQARVGQARAESASREKSAFLSRMSHELRTPLNAVMGFAHLLAMDAAIAAVPQSAQRVGMIQDSAKQLLSLISEVLDLSRLEAGAVVPTITSFDLVSLRNEVAAMLAPLAAEFNVCLSLPACEEAVHAAADRHRTRQVLLNLLSNAIKYNHPGGEVTVQLRDAGQWVEVAVMDNGIGLSDEQRLRLFQPFSRVGAEHTLVPGLGLGLSISKQLAEAMQGRLEVSSEPGVGSVFTLVLPRGSGTSAAVTALETVPATSAARPHRLKVLYIEDNPVNVVMMQALLEKRPQVLFEFAIDGASGLAAARRWRPDLVLLDMQLPDVDGGWVLRQIRADPELSRTRIVAVSADAMEEQQRAGLAAGLDAYLTKPINFDRLLSLVDDTPSLL